MDEREKEIMNDIINILKKEKNGLTIGEITRKMMKKRKITRQTLAKYLFALELSGKLTKREIGRAKLFRLA